MRPRQLDVLALVGLMPQGTWQPPGTSGHQEVEVQQPVLPLLSPCVSSSESRCRVVVKCSQLFKCQRNPRRLQKWNSVEHLLRNWAKCCPEKPEQSHPVEPGGSMVWRCSGAGSRVRNAALTRPVGRRAPNYLTYLGRDRSGERNSLLNGLQLRAV